MYRLFLSVLLMIPALSPETAFSAPPADAATNVIITPVIRTSFVDEVEALGTLYANESVELTASVTELVTAINFEDGERVEKGRVLIEMDAAEEQAQLSEEQSTLEEAHTQLKRVLALASRGVSSESVLDEREREFKTAKARLKAVQSRIDQRNIKAPFDGVVGLRKISVGSLIQPGSIITTIDDDSVMKLDFSVPEVFLSALKPTIKIEAYTKAYPNEIFTGTISSVDSRIDPVTRAIVARALIENPERKLKPGLLMQVTVQKNPRETLVIPEEAIITNGNQHSVLITKQTEEFTTVEKRIVTIGARRKGDVEILEGLTIDDNVVTHGSLNATPGKAVKIIAIQQDDAPLSELIHPTKTEAQNEAGT